jgi:hypothetical protein
MHVSWDTQMPGLVNAYLNWRYGPAQDLLSLSTPLSDNQLFFEVTAIDIKGTHIFSLLLHFSLFY